MMGKSRLRPVFGLLAASLLLSSPSAATDPEPAQVPETAPGTGALCLFALTSVAAEVGRRCRSGENEDFQVELDRTVGQFEAYVLSNSEANAEQVAEFRRRQGGTAASTEALCEGDAVVFYESVVSRGIETFRREVDHILRRPGPPTWGDCL